MGIGVAVTGVPRVSAKPKEIRVFLLRQVDAGRFTPLDLHSASWAGLLLCSESVRVRLPSVITG